MKKFLFGILGLLFAVPAVAATLPAGYTELEYIQGDKSAYLKSGIILDNNSGVEAKFQFPNTEGSNTGNFICGARNSGPQNAFTLVGFSGGSYWASNYNNSGETFGHADTNIHIIKRDKEKVYFDGSLVLTSASATFTTPGEAYVFSINQGGTPFLTSNIKLWYLKMWDNGTLVRDFVPAKRNSDNVVGMYDTVSGTFFTNAGTGTFTAGPVLNSCRNLLQPNACTDGYYYTETGEYTDAAPARLTDFIPVVAGQPYTIKLMKSGSTNLNLRVNFFDSNKTWLSQSVFAIGNAGTFVYNTVTPQQNGYIRISANRDIGSQNGVFVDYNTYMIVHGEYNASNYPEYCVPESSSSSSPIKIATTAYNSARFSPVVTELNSTIATIRSVVTNTINQTKAIADLQATKQTRPDETCPAGKKCLLVEDDAGQPHWYEIIESPEVQ